MAADEMAAAEVTAASDKLMPPEKCKVKGLKCVKFPTTRECNGIAFGGCVSEFKTKN